MGIALPSVLKCKVAVAVGVRRTDVAWSVNQARTDVAHKFPLTMEDKILKAIVHICGKTHHIPWKTTTNDHFVKERIE